jgi:hypothetical protein
MLRPGWPAVAGRTSVWVVLVCHTHAGTSADVKAYMYLWRTSCSPCLTYGLDVLPIAEGLCASLDSLQGTLIKQSLGLGKRSHHSKLIQAMGIPTIRETIQQMTLALYYRVFQVDSPARDLSTYLLSKYILTGICYANTLVGQVITLGASPVGAALNRVKLPHVTMANDGVVDSLRQLIHHEDYQRPYSEQYKMVKLLCCTF